MSSATFNAIDLSRLPVPPVIEPLDYETILAEMVTELKGYFPDWDETIESDMAVKILQIVAYRRLLDRQRVNDAAKALMLAYAQKGDLDQLGALWKRKRLVLVEADPENNIAEVTESDDAFRERILLAPEGLSVAGPIGAYISNARDASADIKDASAASPTPGVVVVTILTHSGTGEASDELVATVQAALSAETVRPLTDHVTVEKADITAYAVAATYKVLPGPDSAVIAAEMMTRGQAYAIEQKRLGRNITTDGWIAALRVAGISKLTLTSPAADIDLDAGEAGHCTGIDLTFAGVDE